MDEQLSSRERTEVLQCFIQPVISLPEMYLKELWCNAEKVIKGKIQKKEYLLSLAKILEEFQSATDMARRHLLNQMLLLLAIICRNIIRRFMSGGADDIF